MGDVNLAKLYERIDRLEEELQKAKRAHRGKKPWYSRTNWLNVGALVVGVVTTLGQVGVLPIAVVGVAVPLANLILRQVTTQPIVWSDEDLGTGEETKNEGPS